MTLDAECTTFTSTELQAYRGDDDGPIYLSIKGVVYDVTASRHLYGPEGPYHVFAGRECARALALFSLSEKDCVGDLHRLEPDQFAALDEWIEKFRTKYPTVGHISESLFQRIANFFTLSGVLASNVTS